MTQKYPKYPKIVDDDHGTVYAEYEAQFVRAWGYDNRESQRLAMFKAREFAEGWFQCAKMEGKAKYGNKSEKN